MADRTDTPALRPPTTDRRALFSAAALLGVAAVLPGTIPAAAAAVIAPVAAAAANAGAAHADAELLALCAVWSTANDEYMSVWDRLDDIDEDDHTAADRALGKKVHRVVHDLEHRIFDMPAATMAGLKAKAEILAFMGDEMGIPVDSSHGWSLVRDILALGSAA